jgi:hypothetical protein
VSLTEIELYVFLTCMQHRINVHSWGISFFIALRRAPTTQAGLAQPRDEGRYFCISYVLIRRSAFALLTYRYITCMSTYARETFSRWARMSSGIGVMCTGPSSEMWGRILNKFCVERCSWTRVIWVVPLTYIFFIVSLGKMFLFDALASNRQQNSWIRSLV